jgi:hypothetical protein
MTPRDLLHALKREVELEFRLRFLTEAPEVAQLPVTWRRTPRGLCVMPQLVAVPEAGTTLQLWLVWMNQSLQEAAVHWHHLHTLRSRHPAVWAKSVVHEEVGLWSRIGKVSAQDIPSWSAVVKRGIHMKKTTCAGYCRAPLLVDEMLTRVWRIDLLQPWPPHMYAA